MSGLFDTRAVAAEPGHEPDSDAWVSEIEPCPPARLARALERAGVRTVSLLESAQPSERWGRWSYVALAPHRAFAYVGTERAWRIGEGAASAPAPGLAALERGLIARARDPWGALDQAWADVAGRIGAARRRCEIPFRGGLVVGLSYDAARALPDFTPWSDVARDDRDWPWLDVRVVGDLVALEHATGRAFLVIARHPMLGPVEPRLERARATIESALRYFDPVLVAENPRARLAPAPARDRALRSNMSDAEYACAFDRLQEYLRAGDLYQANLTRRFTAPWADDAGALYARLRALAPAPYAGWLAAPWGHALSASPELFLAREGNRLLSRPIKGTRPRRADAAEDAAEARALAASAKDRAEHVMIVDVHRNDLGRVCEFGSVRVETLAGHEAFPTVHHLTSTIVGTPRAGVTPWQAIAVAFPAGSITGAPKRRAIEILEELEPTRRALYCGSIGWIGFDGDFALDVAIRTILLTGGEASFQAGGGIVIDSTCETEAEETWDKARALYAAIAPGGAA